MQNEFRYECKLKKNKTKRLYKCQPFEFCWKQKFFAVIFFSFLFTFCFNWKQKLRKANFLAIQHSVTMIHITKRLNVCYHCMFMHTPTTAAMTTTATATASVLLKQLCIPPNNCYFSIYTGKRLSFLWGRTFFQPDTFRVFKQTKNTPTFGFFSPVFIKESQNAFD